MSNLFTPGSYNVVKPHQSRERRGDSGPAPPTSKPKIPTAEPIKGKSPRKKSVTQVNKTKPSAVLPSKGSPVESLHLPLGMVSSIL